MTTWRKCDLRRGWPLKLALLLGALQGRIAQTSPLGKCCDPDQVLIPDAAGFSCAPAPPDASEVVLGPEIVGLPVCRAAAELGVSKFEDAKDGVFDDACVDVLFRALNNSYPVVLQCRGGNESQGGFSSPRILSVRKCCGFGEVFSVDRKACVSVLREESSWLEELPFVEGAIKDGVILAVSKGPPRCENAIVDHEINATDVTFVNNGLQVTSSAELTLTESTGCLDRSSSGGLLVARVCSTPEFCLEHACLRKCCPEDQALFFNECRPLPSSATSERLHQELVNFSQNVSEDDVFDVSAGYGVLVGKPCKHGMYPTLPEERWHMTSRGHVYVPTYKTFDHQEHCMDMFYNNSEFREGLYPFVCFPEPSVYETSATRFGVNAALELTSCTFLLLTLLVYICLPSLQNLHGKTLMCHVASLFMAYVCHTVVVLATPESVHWDPNLETHDWSVGCKALGYSMLFFFLSAFSWLNVMCFDIWRTFGGLKRFGNPRSNRHYHLKRFLSYCTYAWGLALGITGLGILADSMDILPLHLRPNIGTERCFFAQTPGYIGEILFFMGPLSIQLLANVVFFVLTAVSCSKVKAEIRKVMAGPADPRSRRFQADRTKFIMNVKLFTVMGISWVLEVVSFHVNRYATNLQWKEEFFYIPDAFNCLQGLLIFVLFVMKRNVYQALKRRLGIAERNPACVGGLRDPYKVRMSASNSTLMSTFAVSTSP
ncbi:G-protein coupled receptor Mth2 [Orussus abietinus]|uniref:G-protein coupled receptor Mth2 n=1 Tax=Orussus abietinus TaxID=222816 RepID=UPI0006263D46|nr:G-protein coupled receptor Mth2 [Orussus abietinus]